MASMTEEPVIEPQSLKVTEPEPTPQAATNAREYVILQALVDADNQWAELGTVNAASSDEAIRKAAAVQAADPDIDTTGVLTYVAVPSRSFQPVELTARVEPKIEFRSR
jgi:hypothetical protein